MRCGCSDTFRGRGLGQLGGLEFCKLCTIQKKNSIKLYYYGRVLVLSVCRSVVSCVKLKHTTREREREFFFFFFLRSVNQYGCFTEREREIRILRRPFTRPRSHQDERERERERDSNLQCIRRAAPIWK